MKPGSSSLAAAIVLTALRRSSLTRRYCKVLLARSTRPLAWGVLAQTMSMLSACSARPNWVIPPAFAGAGSGLGRAGRVDAEHAVLVAIEGDRLAVHLQILPRRPEVVEGRFRLDQLQLHQSARGVVDVDEQRALRTTVFEPPVLGTVDLDQLAQTVAAAARLLNRPQACLASETQTLRHHPLT